MRSADFIEITTDSQSGVSGFRNLVFDVCDLSSGMAMARAMIHFARMIVVGANHVMTNSIAVNVPEQLVSKCPFSMTFYHCTSHY